MECINVLSLDLDWFNYIQRSQSVPIGQFRAEIDQFFARLSKSCSLPSRLSIMKEHHYLYPWANALAIKHSAHKINIVNIDEHHDFYNLRDSAWKNGKRWVDCTNFFGFMAHDRRLGDYLWVTTETTKEASWVHGKDLMANIKQARSPMIRQFCPKRSLPRHRFIQAVKGRKFDGFVIVRSPQYTANHRSVYHAVDLALSKWLPKIKVKKHTHRQPDFLHGNLHAIQQSFGTCL